MAPNLKVFTHAQVKKLNIKEGRVTGANLRLGQVDASIDASCEVILSAGAIGSPQIMQLSGLGPGKRLQDNGVEVIKEIKGVGENLQDHLQLRCIYKIDGVKTLNQRANSLLGRMAIGLEYALFRSGPMSMAPSQLGAFGRSDPSYETPNVEFHVQPLSLDKFGDPLHKFPAFTASICNLRPESRGYVGIQGPDPFTHPEIQPNYLSASADLKVAADSIKLARKIVAQPALQKFNPREYLPGPSCVTDDDLAKAAGEIGTTIFHPTGTCKMGMDDMAVVDERLRVYGVPGLRVVDASIMPTITSGNTNSPVIMMAEKAADMIRKDRQG